MQQLIKAIHESPGRFELAITGGGSSAVSQLLAEPGASNSLLNAQIPYSFAALCAYVGTEVSAACSEETARMMATRAYRNALTYHDGEVLGIGATAALQTNRERRGSDRIHVAVQTSHSLATYRLDLDSTWSRAAQEAACCNFILNCLAIGLNLTPIESVAPTRQIQVSDAWSGVYAGISRSSATESVMALLPGAFNPPHEGHLQMREVAEHMLGRKVFFELSIENVDKPDLDFFAMRDRQDWLDDAPLVFTRAATFAEKSKLFPGAAFVVGIDTLIRIDDKKYYGQSEQAKQSALVSLAENGHEFLVFGRLVEGTFQGLDDFDISPTLRAICTQVPEDKFRVDVSSTELRGNATRRV